MVLVLVAILTYSSLVYFAETHSYSTQEVEGVNCTGWVKDLRRKTWWDSIWVHRITIGPQKGCIRPKNNLKGPLEPSVWA